MPAKPVPKLKLYTTSWCAFCRAEKKFLDAHHIPYTAVNVETDPTAGQEMIDLSGQMGVPFTLITKPNGDKVGIVGFDQPRLAAELGLSS